jgi:hypothetical protein
MTKSYTLFMYYVHSYLESVRGKLHIDENTTVENFQDNATNRRHCEFVCEYAISQYSYELSYNQLANGINLFIKANKK